MDAIEVSFFEWVLKMDLFDLKILQISTPRTQQYLEEHK